MAKAVRNTRVKILVFVTKNEIKEIGRMNILKPRKI
jgi:hypothetical protein